MRMPTFPKFSGVSPKKMIADPWPFVATWILGGFLALLIPVIHWNRKKQEYYDAYGYQVEYENAQRAYEEANNGNNNNNNNNYYQSNCSWWQWQCRKKAYYYQQQNQDGGGEDEVQVPNWYLFIGGQTEEQRRQAEENGELGQTTAGALKLVYWWTLLLFCLIVAYGAAVLIKGKDARATVFCLLLFSQFALMLLLLMGQGVIASDNRDLEDSVYGWHGQMGVLLAYTSFWMVLYCLVFTVALTVRLLLQHRQNKRANNNDDDGKEDPEATNYKEYEEPKVTMTPA